jgi:hypothetical protein
LPLGAAETNAVTAKSVAVEMRLIIDGGRKEEKERGKERNDGK